jgi:hypothetical protein
MNLQAKAKSKYEGGRAIGGNHCDQTRVTVGGMVEVEF